MQYRNAIYDTFEGGLYEAIVFKFTDRAGPMVDLEAYYRRFRIGLEIQNSAVLYHHTQIQKLLY
jgi:hypothetical protein